MTPTSQSEAEEALARALAIEHVRDAVRGAEFYRRFSDEEIESLYAVAHAIFERGRYAEARDAFKALLVYRPFDARLLFALGSALRRTGEHAGAVLAFVGAAQFEPWNLEPGFRAAECLLLMNETGRAKEALSALREVAQERGDGAALARADGMLELLAGAGT